MKLHGLKITMGYENFHVTILEKKKVYGETDSIISFPEKVIVHLDQNLEPIY